MLMLAQGQKKYLPPIYQMSFQQRQTSCNPNNNHSNSRKKKANDSNNNIWNLTGFNDQQKEKSDTFYNVLIIGQPIIRTMAKPWGANNDNYC